MTNCDKKNTPSSDAVTMTLFQFITILESWICEDLVKPLWNKSCGRQRKVKI